MTDDIAVREPEEILAERLAPQEPGDGWVLISMHDPQMRRGVWIRHSENTFEVCSGREGNDHRVTIKVGEVFDPHTMRALFDALDTGRWMIEEDAERLLKRLEEIEVGT